MEYFDSAASGTILNDDRIEGNFPDHGAADPVTQPNQTAVVKGPVDPVANNNPRQPADNHVRRRLRLTGQPLGWTGGNVNAIAKGITLPPLLVVVTSQALRLSTEQELEEKCSGDYGRFSGHERHRESRGR